MNEPVFLTPLTHSFSCFFCSPVDLLGILWFSLVFFKSESSYDPQSVFHDHSSHFSPKDTYARHYLFSKQCFCGFWFPENKLNQNSYPHPPIFAVLNSSFSVDVCQRKNDFWNFLMTYSTSEILRLGRRKVQVRILKKADLFVHYILT